jgi:hypothetical protein
MKERYEYLLDQYFSRRITPAEKNELDLLVANNPAFADVFGFQQKVSTTVISNERTQLKALLQQEEAKNNKGGFGTGGGWSIWTKTLMAAAAAIMVAVAIYFINLNGKAVEMSMTFIPYPNEFASAGGGDTTSILQKASNDYQSGQFAAAGAGFSQLDKSVPAHAFYYGVSLVGAKDYPKALEILAPIATSGNPDYAMPAQYYIAWSHFQSGNLAGAKLTAKAYLKNPVKKGQELMRANAQKMAE